MDTIVACNVITSYISARNWHRHKACLSKYCRGFNCFFNSDRSVEHSRISNIMIRLDPVIGLGCQSVIIAFTLNIWTVVITQPQSIVVGKHFSVTIIKLLHVIPIIHLLPIYFCTNSSWNVRASMCLEGCLSLLALSSVYSPTEETESWSTPLVQAQLSVPLQQVEE